MQANSKYDFEEYRKKKKDLKIEQKLQQINNLKIGESYMQKFESFFYEIKPKINIDLGNYLEGDILFRYKNKFFIFKRGEFLGEEVKRIAEKEYLILGKGETKKINPFIWILIGGIIGAFLFLLSWAIIQVIMH